jgi:hypothetical protein
VGTIAKHAPLAGNIVCDRLCLKLPANGFFVELDAGDRIICFIKGFEHFGRSVIGLESLQ